jgi:hypothetical protein
MYQFATAGNVTIIIRAIAPIHLLGTDYQTNDVIAYFEHANFVFDFQNINKNIKASAQTLLSFNVMAPESITIQPKLITHNLFNFIAARKLLNTEIVAIPITTKMSADENGEILLQYLPTSDKELWIKNQNRINVDANVNYSNGLITNLVALENYLIFYYTYQDVIIAYSLEKVELPYFKIEILGKTNINGLSRDMLITIPRAALEIQDNLKFEADRLADLELKFHIIKGEASIVYY